MTIWDVEPQTRLMGRRVLNSSGI